MKKHRRLFILLCLLSAVFCACEKLEVPGTEPPAADEEPAGNAVDTTAYPTEETSPTLEDTVNYVISHGEMGNPYTVSDFKTYIPAMFASYGANGMTGSHYVRGYIVGYIKGASLSQTIFQAGATETNIVLADSPDEVIYHHCIPVQLTKSSANSEQTRDALNLHSHPENLGKEVLVCGSIGTYMGTYGIKNARAYDFLP